MRPLRLTGSARNRQRFPSGKPVLAVAGGTGKALSTAVLTLGALGYDITVMGRHGLSPLQRDTLFNRRNVRYEAIDILAAESGRRLQTLARRADIFVMGAEPYPVGGEADSDTALDGIERLYLTLHDAGYTTSDNEGRRQARRWPKRVVRIGSPPAEIPRGLRHTGEGYLEDAASAAMLRRRAASHPNWQNPYFQTKVRCALLARQAVTRGLDLVTAAPTAVISWAGDWAEREPVVQFRRLASRGRLSFMPSTLSNAVPGDVVARGIMLAALAGRTGDTFQLAGADLPSADPVRHVLAAIGEPPPPVRHYSPADLNRHVRLLTGESIVRSASDAVEYGRLAVGNVGLMWANALTLGLLTPVVGAKIACDVAAGSQRAIRNLYDNAETLALEVLGIEAWQVAVLAEMQSRSSTKLRSLNGAVAGTRFAHLMYPETATIAASLPEAFERQAVWLGRRGLIPRPTTRSR